MPNAITSRKANVLPVDIESTANFISSVQKQNGEIPWSKGGKTDHWDHIESAMGLAIGGLLDGSKKAYLWSLENQLEDGSWWSYYREDKPEKDAYKDPNMSSYIAVGVLHYYLITRDMAFLNQMWPTICRAMEFVLELQDTEGQIFWAKRKDGSIDKSALLTGSSSIYFSLTCALKISSLLGRKKPHWEVARINLLSAIRYKPHLFDQSKLRFSMDWYYPVLSGIVKGEEAQKRIESLWDTFIIDGWGVRCVSDAEWLTMAETSELVVALAASGNQGVAETVFGWIQDKKYDDGAFWTGVTFPDREIYTTEKTSWTCAAVLIAADILYDLTSASKLFSHAFWKPLPFASNLPCR